VPSLADRAKDDKPLTMRERMEQHRSNPVCAGCHRLMDPLGFALENFTAVGRWRALENGNPVDAAGALPDGTAFEGPVELRKLLLKQRDLFIGTMTEKLVTYALGRGVEPYDMPAIRRITREAAQSDYRWSSLVLGIAKSLPFQMTMSLESPGAQEPHAGSEKAR
jgi:hypothetical protein